ncbi:MAG: amidohydrolase family protein [Planctomycetota bacterium]
MSTSTASRSYRARWVFPVAGPPIDGGVVEVVAGRIADVRRRKPGDTAVDLCAEQQSDVAILPSLVNAHTHLELSDLSAPVCAAGTPMPDWIRAVIAHRARPEADRIAAIQQGLDECRASGAAVIADIVQTEIDPTSIAAHAAATTNRGDVMMDGNAALWLLLCGELIGPTPERAAQGASRAKRFIADWAQRGSESAAAACSPGLCLGLSPHAPYTVHPRLLEECIELSRTHRLPLVMHLAESPEELELLSTGRGPMRALLEDLGAWHEELVPPGAAQSTYLKRLADADRALVIHGNYLDDDAIALLAENRQRMAVVYCPRTHAYFGHAPHPLPQLLAAAAQVCLGTDSRASSPDLNLFREMQHIAAHTLEISPAAILRLGTLSGAEALGAAHEFGSLQPHRKAALAVARLGASSTSDPHDRLLSPESEIIGLLS